MITYRNTLCQLLFYAVIIHMHPLVKLAKNAVKTYINDGKIIAPPFTVPQEFLERKAGVFVSIRNDSQLRGCIGTYMPAEENIVQEVVSNAIAAAMCDNHAKIRLSPPLKRVFHLWWIK